MFLSACGNLLEIKEVESLSDEAGVSVEIGMSFAELEILVEEKSYEEY